MNKSVYFKSLLMIFCAVGLLSCKKENQQSASNTVLEVQTFSNLYAPQNGGQGQAESGSFTRFSFSKNDTVKDNSWDIAFRGTTIVVNGGARIGISDEPERTGNAAVSTIVNTFEGVDRVPEAGAFKQDASGSYAIATGAGNGWYNYDSNTHLITPIAGKVFVFKTNDGKYAKVEILSYYKDAPANPNAFTSPTRYYTFRYVYQPSGTTF